MKTIIFSSALAFVSFFSASSGSAQDLAGVFSNSTHSTATISSSAPSTERILLLNEVNMRAIRDFSKKYRDAKDAIWVNGEAGQSVYFTLNGMKMRATYSKWGNLEYSLKYYNESSMSAELRHIVKSTYYDYSIQQVTEVKRNEMVYYLVKMANQREFLTVKVVEGQMDIFERIGRLQ